MASRRDTRGSSAVGRLCRLGVGLGVFLTVTGTGSLGAPTAAPANPSGGTNAVGGEIRGWTLAYRKDGELKAKLYGGSARPLPGGLLEIRELKVETYRDGEPQAVLTTPLCRYRPGDDVVDSTNTFGVQLADNRGRLDGEGFQLRMAAKEVSSAGPFAANASGGRLQLRGTGFHFRLEASQMVVSNQVQALIPVRLPKRFIP